MAVNVGVVNYSQNAKEEESSSEDEDKRGKSRHKKVGDRKKPKRTPVEKIFRVFYRLDEQNYPTLWTTQSYIHIVEAFVHLVAACFLVVLYLFSAKYVSLYEGYSGAYQDILMMALSASGTPISLLSGLLVCYSITQKRLGRCRFNIFFATGSSAVLALSSLILTAVSLGSFLTAANIFKAGFYQNMKKFHADRSVKESIVQLQESFECCGNTNYTDWFTIGWSPSITASKVGLPLSCCKRQGTNPCFEFVELEELNSLTPYHEGCNGKVQTQYVTYTLISGSLFALSFIIDILSTGLSYTNSKSALSHENLIFEDRMKIIPQKLRANRLMRAKRNKIMRS
ncbi:hypothetical protein HELRODRAFT_169962 [Helobdella robusta]|uniref:Tetraspanin n=1 Tax=Helobdella robusta TaxID=6412 RepID=T1F2H5_HELRO|nr:hypothetical protein HELRODRAFT_169962 [Helobdella robusta]ESO08223.1 hypothetical protein HELRODRAFT_169962 [Helobdella robusta]